MKKIRTGRSGKLRKTAAAAATVCCLLLLPVTAFADMISDAPVMGSETSSSGSTGVSSEALVSDSPMVSGQSSSGHTQTVIPETASSQLTNIPPESVQEKTEEVLPVISNTAETGAAAAGSLSSFSKEQETGTAKKAEETLPAVKAEPETAAKPAENAAVAELPSISAPETTEGKSFSIDTAPAIEMKTAAAVSAPQVSGTAAASASGEAGEIHANDSATRIYLDFSLISPNHKYGSSSVARASVKLSNGSWQKFEYKEHIRYPYYKLSSQGTDSDGDSCYIASVYARRFGDSTTDDGEVKTQLYMKAADCTVKNYFDVTTSNAKRTAIVKAALSMLGKQYVYGGNGPEAFDCSGFVKYVMAQAGISVPRTSTQLLSMSGQISASELRPGDIMARAGHCGIYIGNGMFIHASDSSVGVIAEYLSVYNQTNKFTNCINVVGD